MMERAGSANDPVAKGASVSAADTAPRAADVRAVLFDLDGTLADTYALILATFHYAVREVLGRDYPDDVLMQKVGQPLAVQMWDFTDDEAVHGELCRVYRERNAVIHEDYIRRFPGTRDAIVALVQAGMPVGVVTSKRHGPATKALVSCGLDDVLPVVVGSDDWPENKPAPGPVLHGCDLLGVAPNECAYVGDSPFDLQAGRAAGCFTVAATWGMFPPDVLAAEAPDATCSSISDVVKLFL